MKCVHIIKCCPLSNNTDSLTSTKFLLSFPQKNIRLHLNMSLKCSFFKTCTCTHPGWRNQNPLSCLARVLHNHSLFYKTHCWTQTQWHDLLLQAPRGWWKCWECGPNGHWHFIQFVLLAFDLYQASNTSLTPPRCLVALHHTRQAE